MFKVINNFLSNKNYKVINNAMNEEYFPWYYNNYKVDGDNELFHYQMTHVFYRDGKICIEAAIYKTSFGTIFVNSILFIKLKYNTPLISITASNSNQIGGKAKINFLKSSNLALDLAKNSNLLANIFT